MNKKKFIIAIIILLFDQISKLIVSLFSISKTIIPGFFGIHYCQNTGAAWSILEGHQGLLIIITILVLILVYNMMFSFEENRLNDLAFGLLFGGIVGNLIDRILYSYVRDFISFNIFGYAFPVFNIADLCIGLGVILIIYITIKGEISNANRSKRRRHKNR